MLVWRAEPGAPRPLCALQVLQEWQFPSPELALDAEEAGREVGQQGKEGRNADPPY